MIKAAPPGNETERPIVIESSEEPSVESPEKPDDELAAAATH
jgi:hypothetical protein